MVSYEHKTVPPISRRMTGALQPASYYFSIELATVLYLFFHLEVTDLFLSGNKRQQDCLLKSGDKERALPFFSTFLLTTSILQYSCAHLNELTNKQTAPMTIDKSRGGKCAQNNNKENRTVVVF